jgi:hypothetical protein
MCQMFPLLIMLLTSQNATQDRLELFVFHEAISTIVRLPGQRFVIFALRNKSSFSKNFLILLHDIKPTCHRNRTVPTALENYTNKRDIMICSQSILLSDQFALNFLLSNFLLSTFFDLKTITLIPVWYQKSK